MEHPTSDAISFAGAAEECRRNPLAQCHCGAYVPNSRRFCNLCGREVNPQGRLDLVSDRRKPAKKGTTRSSPIVPEAAPSIRDYYGAPEEYEDYSQPIIRAGPRERLVVEVLESHMRRDKKGRAYDASQITRRVELVARGNGIGVFRLPGAAGIADEESRPFPVREARREPGTVRVEAAFREFVARLGKRGWKECGRGARWYEREFSHTRQH